MAKHMERDLERLRKAVLQRITPLPSRTPSPNIPSDWPQPLLEESDSHQAPSPVDERQHLESRSKTPYVLSFVLLWTIPPMMAGTHSLCPYHLCS